MFFCFYSFVIYPDFKEVNPLQKLGRFYHGKSTSVSHDAKTFYLATAEENGQPHVCPFGAAAIINGKICICTNNQKAVYQQMKTNPKVEINGMAGGKWIRLSAAVCEDERRESKAAMLQAHPELSGMYSLDDGIFAVIALTSGTAQICSFTDASEEIKF